MKYFQDFNFDIIVIIVVLSGIIFGLYYSAFRQALKTTSFVVPIIALYFVLTPVMKIIYRNITLINVRDKFFNFISKIIDVNKFKNILTVILVAFILYLIMHYLIVFIFKMFSPKQEKALLDNKKILSRISGAFISLFSSYVLIVLLVYFLNPFVPVNDNSKFTKLILSSSDNIIEISKAHKYQNTIPLEYQEYQETLDLISGDKVLKSLNKYIEYNENLSKLEVLIFNNYNELSNESKTLLNNDTSYAKLLSKVNNKFIIDNLITYEKDNPNINLIINYRDRLINNFYLYKINEDYYKTSLNKEDFINKLILNKSTIVNLLPSKLLKKSFDQEVKEYDYFINNYKNIYSLLSEEDCTIDNYHLTLNMIFSDDAILKHFVDIFLNEYKDDNNEVVIRFRDLLIKYKQYKTNIEKLNPQISFASKIIYAMNYHDIYESKLLKENLFLQAILIDNVRNNSFVSHDLYFEYLFFDLIGSFDENNKINNEKFDQLILKLVKFEEENKLKRNDIILYLDSLFNEEGLIKRLDEKNLIDQGLYEYIKQHISPYISQSLKSKIS